MTGSKQVFIKKIQVLINNAAACDPRTHAWMLMQLGCFNRFGAEDRRLQPLPAFSLTH
jgi:hypothetical protein